jgi:excisionase family DNA binding protein
MPVAASRGCSLVVLSAQAAPEPTRTLLSPEQVAALAGVSLSTVRRAIDSGELRAAHVGRLIRIRPADFDRYLDREREGAP